MAKVVRPLSTKERRVLERGLARERKLKRGLRQRTWTVPLSISGTLWALTAWADPEHWKIAAALWLVIGVGMLFWGVRSYRKEGSVRVDRYESALRRNEVFVYRIAADEMVQFEEIEDEGACYAFQLEGDKIVFLNSQELYPSARFPNNDFEIVRIFDDEGVLIEEVVEKFGTTIKPLRVIPAKVKRDLRDPGHLEVISGRLESLEMSLAVR